MTCEHVALPGGETAIVCSRAKSPRCACGRAAPLLCDWKVSDRKSGTCDEPICERCAISPAPDKDLCPQHAREFKAWKQERQPA